MESLVQTSTLKGFIAKNDLSHVIEDLSNLRSETFHKHICARKGEVSICFDIYFGLLVVNASPFIEEVTVLDAELWENDYEQGFVTDKMYEELRKDVETILKENI